MWLVKEYGFKKDPLVQGRLRYSRSARFVFFPALAMGTGAGGAAATTAAGGGFLASLASPAGLSGLGALTSGAGALMGGGGSLQRTSAMNQIQRNLFRTLGLRAQQGINRPMVSPYGTYTPPTATQRAGAALVGPLASKIGARGPVPGAEAARAKVMQRLGSPKDRVNEAIVNSLAATQKKIFSILNDSGGGAA